MKKIAVILMTCIYALSSFGIGIKQFYCCGILKSTNISFVQNSNVKCGMGDETGGCCKTKFKSFQVKDSHIVAGDIGNPIKQFTESQVSTTAFEVLDLTNGPIDVANPGHAPPGLAKTPVYLLNCNFRI